MAGTLVDGGAADDEALDDAAFWDLDLSAEDLASASESGVWEQNADAVEAFLAVCTQWNIVGRPEGGLLTIGLDYEAASAGLELAGIELDPETWARVRIVEDGAKAAMNGD